MFHELEEHKSGRSYDQRLMFMNSHIVNWRTLVQKLENTTHYWFFYRCQQFVLCTISNEAKVKTTVLLSVITSVYTLDWKCIVIVNFLFAKQGFEI